MVVDSKPGKKQLGQIQTLDRRISDLGYFVIVMPINLAAAVVVVVNLKGRTEKKSQSRLPSWVVVTCQSSLFWDTLGSFFMPAALASDSPERVQQGGHL